MRVKRRMKVIQQRHSCLPRITALRGCGAHYRLTISPSAIALASTLAVVSISVLSSSASKTGTTEAISPATQLAPDLYLIFVPAAKPEGRPLPLAEMAGLA